MSSITDNYKAARASLTDAEVAAIAEFEAAIAALKASIEGLAEAVVELTTIVNAIKAQLDNGETPTSPPPPPPPPPSPPEGLDPVGTKVTSGSITVTGPSTWAINNGVVTRDGVVNDNAAGAVSLEVVENGTGGTTVLGKEANGQGYVFNVPTNQWLYRVGQNGEATPIPDGTWRDGKELANGMPSTWGEGKLANGTWAQDHISINGSSVVLTLDGSASAQIQALEGSWTSGEYGVVVNFDNAHRGGIVGAPLWMYSGYGEGYKDGLRFELDFEFIGTKGLQINYHDGSYPGYEVMTIPGNFDGVDTKLEIKWDMEAGYADFYVNDELVKHLTKAEVESKGKVWVNKPMWPFYDIWATTNSDWTGGSFDPNQTTKETIKSYKIKI